MKKKERKLFYVVLAWALIAFSAFSGCGKKGDPDESFFEMTKKEKEHEKDMPWNHGLEAIMETETGYYSSFSDERNYLQALCLRYYEKASGETILLCNKPECQHNGDDACEATYKNIQVVNALLYEGAIYILGMEKEKGAGVNEYGEQADKTVAINLYKAALDGSSIDKVGCVISSEVPMDQSGKTSQIRMKQRDMFEEIFELIDYSFIIHDGAAYIPYYLRFGQASKEYKGGGLVKMDLKTGETKTLYEAKTVHHGVPAFLMAKGDYVWFQVYGQYKGSRIKRYNIKTEEVEDFYGNTVEEPKDQIWLMNVLLGENRVYELSYEVNEKKNPTVWRFRAFDRETGEYHPEETIVTDVSCDQGRIRAAFVYEGKLFLANLYGCYCYDGQGNKVAELSFPQEQTGLTFKKGTTSTEDKAVFYKISNDKLYLIFSDEMLDPRYRSYNANAYRKRVFTCPLKDFYSGNGSWTEVFTIEGRVIPEDPGFHDAGE